METERLATKHKLNLKYILIFILSFGTIFSDILTQKNLNNQIAISSIFIFIIIGLTSSNSSLLIITLLNCILFKINGFNLLSCILALEIYYVWFLYKKNKKNIVIEVLIFWIVLVLPFIFITSYASNFNFRVESLFFIFMVFLSRIFNALISDIILDYIPFQKIIGNTYISSKIRTLANFLVYSTIATVVIPIIVFFLLTNSNVQKQTSEEASKDLKNSFEYVNQKVNLWTIEEKNNLKLKSPIQVYNFTELLKNYVSTSTNTGNFYLLDFDELAISNDNSINNKKKKLEWLKDGSLTKINSNMYKWIASRENKFMIKDYVAESDYLYVTIINGLKVVIIISGDVYDSKSIDIYLNLLKILLPLCVLFGIFIIILKRLLLNSMSKLITITSDLPQKLEKKETVIFKKSNIYEIDLLIVNFQTMVYNLTNMILKVEAANKKLQESERMLFQEAHFDSLTGLSNRHYFIKYVGGLIENFATNKIYANKQGIAFFFTDLDKFKSVNDTFGHVVGDKLLQEIANRMNNVLEIYDSSCTFIARLGGDEFVIQFIYDDKEQIIYLANAIIETIKKPIVIEDNKIDVGISIGICLYPEDAKDIEGVFIKSDTSMYKAKSSGGNTFIFYSSLN